MPYHCGMNRDEKREYNRLYQIANKERIAARREARRAGLGEDVRRCSVPGCNGVYEAAGYCGRHYMAFRRHGDPTAPVQQQLHGQTVEERYWFRVKKGRGCWEWTGAHNPKGYGVMRVGESARLAHRIAYEQAYGKVPLGLHVMHRCDNPGCVRPDHLTAGTIADNNADMQAKGRARGPEPKLTTKAIRLIGVSSAKNIDLAHRFGVSETTIRAVRRYGKPWRPSQ
jgi:hypothetical protein